MRQVIIEISFTGNNFSAYVPELPGCVSVGDTPAEIKKNIIDAMKLHVQGSIADGDPIPSKFIKGNIELIYKFDTPTLLEYYKGIFTKSGLEKLTGINQKQLFHYSSGLRKPRPAITKRIEQALHQLGKELLAVRL